MHAAGKAAASIAELDLFRVAQAYEHLLSVYREGAHALQGSLGLILGQPQACDRFIAVPDGSAQVVCLLEKRFLVARRRTAAGVEWKFVRPEYANLLKAKVAESAVLDRAREDDAAQAPVDDVEAGEER